MSFRAVVQSLGTPIANIPKNNVFASVEYQIELSKVIKNQLKVMKNNEYIGDEKGKCSFLAQVERDNLLGDLQEFAAITDSGNIEEIYRGTQQTRFNHLIEIRNNIGIYLPTFFFFPMRLAVKQNGMPIFIGSSLKLYTELQEINTSLKAQEKLQLSVSPDSFIAEEEDVEDYEASYEGLQQFWPSFSYIVLECLVKKSIQTKSPIILWSL